MQFWKSDREQFTINQLSKLYLTTIAEIYRSLQTMSDDELAQASDWLIADMQSTKTSEHSDQDLIEMRLRAFGLVKEATRRALKIEIFDEQMIGGWLLCDGKCAEMKTGEGKTILSLLPAFWFALQAKGVHMITVNEYLAQRDCEQMRRVFSYLHLSVGLNLAAMDVQAKISAYQQNVTFGTSTEFGFDYLRDHLIYNPDLKVQRGQSYAIVDEIDSILIDQARTPLILAGKTKAAPDLYHICTRYIAGTQAGRDYEIDAETRQVMFTESGARRIEETFQIDNLYKLDHSSIYHYLLQSLRAKVLFHRDIDYIIYEDKVILVDAFTGRMMEGRQLSEGLHQAIEAKENVPLSEEIRTHAAITLQKYYSLYDLLTGMSGTVKTEEDEMNQIYNLPVVEISTHKPMIRRDEPDLIFASREDKYQGAADEIQRRHLSGQPILVGTTSIKQSEAIARKLEERDLTFRLLNAKTEQEEAEIIAQAGKRGAITIATNMAGRGTDIVLEAGVAELGGLHVIGTERHESRRIDMQFRGRAGRQGDPGSSQFFISLEDELLERFAADEVADYRSAFTYYNKKPATRKIEAFIHKVQKRVEQQMFALRSIVYRMDSIIHEQRQAFYEQREAILTRQVEVMDVLSDHMDLALADLVQTCCSQEIIPEEWDLKLLGDQLNMHVVVRAELYSIVESSSMVAHVQAWWNACCDDFMAAQTADNELKPFEHEQWLEQWRIRLLQMMDLAWQEHLGYTEQIKQGIHYQAYAQRNPILVYEYETWRRFTEMSHQIKHKVSRMLIKEVAERLNQETYEQVSASSQKSRVSIAAIEN